jgi:hypothetical protein
MVWLQLDVTAPHSITKATADLLWPAIRDAADPCKEAMNGHLLLGVTECSRRKKKHRDNLS